MKSLGQFLIVVGILVFIAGCAQLAWVIMFSTDDSPNPVGNGVLLWAAEIMAGLLVGVGVMLWRRAKVRKSRSGFREFPWNCESMDG